MARKIPEATGRRSPDRGEIPKRVGKGAVLDGGIFDRDVLDATKAIDEYKRRENRPFPGLSEVIAVLESKGWSRRGHKQEANEAQADVDELRAEYEARVQDIRRIEMEKGALSCDVEAAQKALKKQILETTYAEEETARLTRLLNKAIATLDGSGEASEAMVKEIRREIAAIKSGRFALFGAEDLAAIESRQAKLEADLAALTDNVADAVKTLEKA